MGCWQPVHPCRRAARTLGRGLRGTWSCRTLWAAGGVDVPRAGDRVAGLHGKNARGNFVDYPDRTLSLLFSTVPRESGLGMLFRHFEKPLQGGILVSAVVGKSDTDVGIRRKIRDGAEHGS